MQSDSIPLPRTVATDCVTKREGKDTVCELVLPWSALGTNPAAGKVLSLNLIVNDNDGHGRAYWMGMRPGIGEAKRPGLYLDVVLAE